MDFALTEEQSAIFDMAQAFGQDHIAPYARVWDAEGTIPNGLWLELASLGFGGLYISEENGGAGLNRLDAILVFEALSRSCASVAALLSIHNMCASMIEICGSMALKDRILSQAVSMKMLLSYCLTEPGCGSDAAALKTKAVSTDDGFTLTGTKAFVSGGGYSDAYVVMARTGGDGPKGISAFVVEDGTKGLSFGGLADKMGWRSQPTRAVQMHGCIVPSRNLLGQKGMGFSYAMASLDGGRLNIAACSIGAAQAALDQTLAYMADRTVFGQSIDQFQGLQFRLANIEIALQSARTFMRQAAWKLDQWHPDAIQFCAMAKKLCTEVGSDVADQCLQLHGGYGCLADYGIEKIVRDLRVHQIIEGTNEIMCMITARHLIKNAGK